jgi:GMP reductase
MRNKINLDFNDVLICPIPASDIRSRTECEVGEILPLFTAPMDTVINRDNMHIFSKDFNICLPRENNGPHVDEGDVFSSYGIEEFEKLFLENEVSFTKAHILIDVANGHMRRLHHTVSLAKKKYPHMILMAGNVAHPETFEILQDCGADYIRVGIGNGGGCLTTVQTGVGYPMASLISECNFLKKESKLVADGGMKSYADIIKALALGADYVMLGSVLNRMAESAGETVNYQGKPHKHFRGMSSKGVQEDWGKYILKTSEGIDKYFPVEYTYSQWVSNFRDYLKSAMSYTGCTTLEEFIGGVELIQISENAYRRFSK